MSNFTQINGTLIGPPTPKSPGWGIVVLSCASVGLVVLVALLLFLRHTKCYSTLRFGVLWCYQLCCRCSPHYADYLEEEARELKFAIDDESYSSTTSDSL